MSMRVSYKKQFLLGIMLLLVFIIVLELVAYTSLYILDYCMVGKRGFYSELSNFQHNEICMNNSQLNFGYIPNLYLIPNQHSETINVNDFGFRGEEISKEKENNTFRIFVVGGSTTFGLYTTSDNSTITGYLQTFFDSKDLLFNVEIINAGIPSAFSYTEIKYIKEKLIDFQPDMFIIYDGYNDLGRDYNQYNSIVGERDNILDTILKVQDYVPIINLQYITSSILNDIKISIDPDRIYKFNSEKTKEKSEIWKERWEEICKINNELGIDTIITLQPIMGTGERELSELEKEFFKRNNGEKKIFAYEEYAERLEEMGGSCKTFDIRDVLDSSEKDSIYVDRVHLTDYGNSIVAEKLFEISLPLVEEKINDD